MILFFTLTVEKIEIRLKTTKYSEVNEGKS